MKKLFALMTGLALIGLVFWGCSNSVEPSKTIETPEQELAKLEAAAWPTCHAQPPSPLVTVQVGNKTLEFWPYTGNNFSGQPQDPINLIFFGKADPRDIRAALLSLSGDRSALGFPPIPPFNGTWDDAIGDVQTGYDQPEGWTGGVIQLACGDYGPTRFHLRLFKMGQWTVGNAHFEVLIPGTADHQVLNWELAEQFVVADFMRSGLLDAAVPMIPTDQINGSPFRTIPAVIYNGLPVELRQLIGGPAGDVTADVPIATDGHAIILNLAKKVAWQPGTRQQDFVIQYGQAVPKPFCSTGSMDYVYVQGPVHLKQTARLTSNGTYNFDFSATGQLTVTPINPATGEPTGQPVQATVMELHSGMLTSRIFSAASAKYQRLGQLWDPDGQMYFTRLLVNSSGCNNFQEFSVCGSDSQ